MPEFWNVLRAFGSKSAPVDESFGGLFCGDEDDRITGVYSTKVLYYHVKK